jgi:hypothetical protein
VLAHTAALASNEGRTASAVEAREESVTEGGFMAFRLFSNDVMGDGRP